MPRTAHTPTALPGHKLPTPWVAVTEDAGDDINGNEFLASGRDLIITRAVGSNSILTVSVVADDDYGRTDTFAPVINIVADQYHVGPLPLGGFRQSDSKIYLDWSTATAKFFVVPLPIGASLIAPGTLPAGAGGSRTLITPMPIAGHRLPTGWTSKDATAGDAANNNYYACSGLDLILAWATAGTPTLTVKSVREPEWGRTGDLVVTLNSATDRYLIGPIPARGFMQSDRSVHLNPSDANVRILVIPLGIGG